MRCSGSWCLVNVGLSAPAEISRPLKAALLEGCGRSTATSYSLTVSSSAVTATVTVRLPPAATVSEALAAPLSTGAPFTVMAA